MLSILIPAYNQSAYIKQAIASALDQICPVPIEVLVCDDASTDNTAAVIETLVPNHSNLRLIKSDRNGGVCVTRNRLMAEMSPETEFVIFLDADDQLIFGRAGKDINRLRENPSARFTYGYFRVVPTKEMERGEEELANWPATRGPSLTAGTFRADLLSEVGSLDESFTYGEDTDYLLRIVEITKDYIAHKDVTFNYRRHPANSTKDDNATKAGVMRAILLHSLRRKKNPALFDAKGLFQAADKDTMKKIAALL